MYTHCSQFFLLVCMQKGAPPPVSEPLHTHGWQGNTEEKGMFGQYTCLCQRGVAIVFGYTA